MAVTEKAVFKKTAPNFAKLIFHLNFSSGPNFYKTKTASEQFVNSICVLSELFGKELPSRSEEEVFTI